MIDCKEGGGCFFKCINFMTIEKSALFDLYRG